MGAASSIVSSGSRGSQAAGQIKSPDADRPIVCGGPALDYESEIGCFIGPGSQLGGPVPLEVAEDHLFGLCLVNDCVYPDVRTWDYCSHSGPFLSEELCHLKILPP